MSSRALFQIVYWCLVGGLIWLVLAVASGTQLWAIIGGLGVGGLALCRLSPMGRMPWQSVRSSP